MIKNILLIQPPYTFEKDIPKIVEMPLGLCYIASVLRENKYNVKILDCVAEKYWQEEQIDKKWVRCGLSFDEIVDEVRRINPDIVGISCLFSIQYPNAKKVLEVIKGVNRGMITVIGGMHPTVATYEVLKDPNLDFVIKGEGEYSFLELINTLNQKKPFEEVDGLAYKKNNAIYINEKKKFIENLDELPFPARDLLPIENYFKAGLAHGFVLKNKRNMNIITSRGCPAGCVFCTIKLTWGRKFRKRSPENVLKEIEYLKVTYDIKHLQFEDDNLTFDKERAKEIFRGMIAKKFNLDWNTPNGVAAWALDRETIDLMKKAGCYLVKIAVESGDQHVLSNIIKKPQDLEHVKEVISYCKKVGLDVCSFFVIGLPGETKEQIQKSFDFPYKTGLDYVEYSIATPHLGTELYQICKENDLLTEDFNISSMYARRANIITDDFTPEWLEKKVKKELIKFILYLMIFRPRTFLKNFKNYFLSNPRFVIRFIRDITLK